MTFATHPTSENLAAFARGDLAASELAAIAEHLGSCGACCAAIARAPDDTLTGLARASGAVKTPGPICSPVPAAAPSATVTDPTPAELMDHPRYRVLGELGFGGMGVVYKAEHRIMDRVVALKVLAPHLTSRPGAAERFGKEVRAAAKLSHPNIITVFDADQAGGLLFLAMEYVEGTSLDRLVAKKGPLPIPMACRFARQTALGLQHAAEKGMVHRDIKPQNLMVTKKADVKIMDFGLARFARNDVEEEAPPAGRLPFGAGKPVADPLTNPNLLMGTPDYLSPEQARNSHAVDARSDIYSLGCTLFFLLTGKPPFAHASSLIDKLLAHTEEAPPAIRQIRPDVPEALAAVLEKMLAKNPNNRHAMAAEVAAALQPFTRASEPPIEVIDAVMVAPPTVTQVTPIPQPSENGPRKVKKARRAKVLPWWKRKWAKIGIPAIAVLVVGGILFAATRGKKTPEPPPPDDSVTKPTPPPSSPPQPTPGPSVVKPVKEKEKELRVLYVLPPENLFLDEYRPVRDRLEANGVKVIPASTHGGFAKLSPGADVRAEPVLIEKQLTVDMDLSPYAAIVFCGEQTRDYIGINAGATAAGHAIRKMTESGKVVAAISNGERILALHGMLHGKHIALNPRVRDNLADSFPGLAKTINWEKMPVVIDGKLVTAADSREAVPFADALLKVMRSE